MSAMEWKTLPVDALRPAAYNPRKKLKAGDKEYEKLILISNKNIQQSSYDG